MDLANTPEALARQGKLLARQVMKCADMFGGKSGAANGEVTVNELSVFTKGTVYEPFAAWLLNDHFGEFRFADRDHSSTLDFNELEGACQCYLEVAGAKRQLPGTDSGTFRIPEGNPVKEAFTGRELSFDEVIATHGWVAGWLAGWHSVLG